MPTPELERLARDLYAAYARGDVDAVVGVAHADVEFVNPPDALEPGVRRGRDEMRAALLSGMESFDSYSVDVDEILDADDDLVVGIRFRGVGLSSQVPIDIQFTHVLTVEDGSLVRIAWFRDRDEALAAAGRARP